MFKSSLSQVIEIGKWFSKNCQNHEIDNNLKIYRQNN